MVLLYWGRGWGMMGWFCFIRVRVGVRVGWVFLIRVRGGVRVGWVVFLLHPLWMVGFLLFRLHIFTF